MIDDKVRSLPLSSAKPPDLSRGIVLTGATEQMFFFGAPLAHVVAYEAWQRAERLCQTYRRQARMSRRAGLALPPVMVPSV
jgi:hypothetical protein